MGLATSNVRWLELVLGKIHLFDDFNRGNPFWGSAAPSYSSSVPYNRIIDYLNDRYIDYDQDFNGLSENLWMVSPSDKWGYDGMGVAYPWFIHDGCLNHTPVSGDFMSLGEGLHIGASGSLFRVIDNVDASTGGLVPYNNRRLDLARSKVSSFMDVKYAPKLIGDRSGLAVFNFTYTSGQALVDVYTGNLYKAVISQIQAQAQVETLHLAENMEDLTVGVSVALGAQIIISEPEHLDWVHEWGLSGPGAGWNVYGWVVKNPGNHFGVRCDGNAINLELPIGGGAEILAEGPRGDYDLTVDIDADGITFPKTPQTNYEPAPGKVLINYDNVWVCESLFYMGRATHPSLYPVDPYLPAPIQIDSYGLDFEHSGGWVIGSVAT